MKTRMFPVPREVQLFNLPVFMATDQVSVVSACMTAFMLGTNVTAAISCNALLPPIEWNIATSVLAMDSFSDSLLLFLISSLLQGQHKLHDGQVVRRKLHNLFWKLQTLELATAVSAALAKNHSNVSALTCWSNQSQRHSCIVSAFSAICRFPDCMALIWYR